ncbi:MAG: A/G-specific adenine glycosylase [Planctomycetota bacterium]
MAPAEGTLADLRAELTAWFRANQRDLPWRRTRDPYAIWVSEAMLQQTRVETVLEYWPRFLERFPTISALADAPTDDVLEAWSGLGYYRRARSLQAAARVLVEQHGAEFPRDVDAALALPGVGPYTAGAVLSIAFNLPVAIVDGNVERVFARWFALEGERSSPALLRECWRAARLLVEERPTEEAAPRDWNQGLMELGALICKPAAPDCAACPVARHCRARAGGRASELPLPKPRRKPVEVELEIFAIEQDGAWLLSRRPPGGLMAEMWEFPTQEVSSVGLFPSDLPDPLEDRLEPLHDLFTLAHGITKHRIRARVRLAGLTGTVPLEEGGGLGWFSAGDAEGLALTGMAKKVLRRLSSDGSKRDLFGGVGGR